MVSAREYIDAIKDEVEEWPGVTLDWSKSGKSHNVVTIHYKGRHQKKFFPCSPSDSGFGVIKAVADVRRMCSILGAARLPPRNKKRPEGEKRRPAPATQPVKAPEPAPSSPFAPLLKLQAGLTDEQLGPWARFRVPPEMLDAGARALIKLWHPQFILRAAEFIQQATRGQDDAGSHEPAGASEGADAAATDRRVG